MNDYFYKCTSQKTETKNYKGECNINEKFFQDLLGEEQINVRCIKNGAQTIDFNSFYNDTLVSSLNQLNGQGYEIYFVPNSGGYKNNQITKINTVFVDIDCGRNDQGEYFCKHEVDEYKQKKLHELNEADLKPSAIVETRNGYHVYWFLNPGAEIEEFSECENILISYFNADVKVKNPARLLRVPDYYWNKDMNNRFLCKIIKRNDIRYDIQEIIDAFTVLGQDSESNTPREHSTLNRKKSKPYISINGPKPSDSKNTNKTYIYERNAAALKNALNASPIEVCSHDEVYDYLKKQDMRKFLGVKDKSFNCIFHDDKNPSATIFQNEETGDQIYYCHSSNCQFNGGTIIQVAGSMLHLDRYSTLTFLREVYQIQYKETAWQQEHKERLDENIRFLLSEELNDYYPELYGRISNYIPQLLTLTKFASSKITTENFTCSDGNPIFYASNRYLARLFGKDPKTVSVRMSLFAYLGIIRRVPDDEVPKFLLTKAKREAAKKKQRYTINFYSIPTYGEELLEFSVKKATEFKEKGFTMKGFSRELILRSLGMDEANRVFPKEQGKQLSVPSDERAARIEATALSLLSDKDWTTEKEILLMLQADGVKLADKFIKRVIPELLDKYGLVKKQSNKQLKEELNITLDSYPKIITWDTEYVG